MKQERILAVHDISCVGRCSLTVALPIVSSVGIECSVLPTAVLSTHTGGFTGFTYRDLTEDIVPIDDHWQTLGITFDAFYTGFLGSFEQIDLVKKLFTDLNNEGTTRYVDPVMADGGKLYPIFGPDFPAGMKGLCQMADVVMPNLTELSLMLEIPYKEGPYTREYIDDVLDKAESLGPKIIVITGVSFEKGKLGAVYKDYRTGETGEVMRDEIPGYYHGTGDVFSSAFVAAHESGLTLKASVEAAVNLTVGSIKRTFDAGVDIRYGVNFEAGLGDYIAEVRNGEHRIAAKTAETDEDARAIERLACQIWNEAYTGILSQQQIDYMLGKFQSFDAVKAQIASGQTYELIRHGSEPVGYVSYKPTKEGLFLSKIYLLRECRGRGIGKGMIAHLCDVAEENGIRRIFLTVNRDNTDAISAYEHFGFRVCKDEDTDIGEGFVMNDHVMELMI